MLDLFYLPIRFKGMKQISAIFSLGALVSGVLFGQAGNGPTFEVASVKRNLSGDMRSSSDAKGSQLTVINSPMLGLLAFAYDIPFDRVEGPRWLADERYDIVAKLPPDGTPEMLRLMMQNLLVERFKLAIHHDQTSSQVYALVAGKKGPNLQSASGDGEAKYRCGRQDMLLSCKVENSTMKQFADDLPHWVSRNWFGRPVVDQTGLDGVYNFTVTWTPTNRADNMVEPPGISLFDAIHDQLGLRLLEQRKVPVDKVVIDHIEKIPTEN